MMGMKILKISLAFLLLVTLPNTSFAMPTLSGPTGLIEVPTAEALQYKEFNLGFDGVESNVPGHESYFYKLNIGTFKGWEVGIVGGTVPAEGVFVNAKYYLMSDSTRLPMSVAIGLQNLTASKNTKVYLVASKKFSKAFGGILGSGQIFLKIRWTPRLLVVRSI